MFHGIWDFRDLELEYEKNMTLIRLIFICITGISMFLCLFSLVSSMTANIRE